MDRNEQTPVGGPLDRLITRKELARLLRVCLRTVSRLVAANQLPPPILVGARWRWRAEDINDFIQGTNARTQAGPDL